MTLGQISQWIWLRLSTMPVPIIAAFIAVCGVMISNRHSRKQMDIQLRHDAEQRERERLMSLRKEVFLQGAEGITKAMAVLGSMSDLDAPTQEFTLECREQAVAFAKIQVVGTDETVQSISKFSNAFIAAYADISFRRMMLIQKKREISSTADLIAKHQSDINRWIDAMREMNIQGGADRDRFQALVSQFGFSSAQLEQQSKASRAQSDTLFGLYLEFSRVCMDHARAITRFVPPVLFAVRDELGLPIDRDRFIAVLDASMAAQFATMDEFIAKLNNAVNGDK